MSTAMSTRGYPAFTSDSRGEKRLTNIPRISLGYAFQLWVRLKENLDFQKDSAFAEFLLESYIKCTCKESAAVVGTRDPSNKNINASTYSQEADVNASNMNLLEPKVVVEYDVDGDIKTEPPNNSPIQDVNYCADGSSHIESATNIEAFKNNPRSDSEIRNNQRSDSETESETETANMLNVDCDDKNSNIGLSLNEKSGSETESDVEVIMLPSIVPKQKKNTQSYGEDYFKKKIFVPNTEKQQEDLVEDNESSTRRSGRLRGKRGTFKLKWNISDQFSDLSDSENEEKSWDRRQKHRSEDEEWMEEEEDEHTNKHTKVCEEVSDGGVDIEHMDTDNSMIPDNLDGSETTEKTPKKLGRGKLKKVKLNSYSFGGSRYGKQWGSDPWALPLPSTYPNIDVTLADHTDKYEISSHVSVCAKDRGLNIEEKTTEQLTCKLCEGKFNCQHEDHMEKHIKEHLEGRLTCQDCQQVFSHKQALVTHRYSEHLKKAHICEICSMEFHHGFLLRNHLGKVHGQKTIKCTSCQEMFSAEEDRRRHVLKEHPTKCVMCEECGEILTTTNPVNMRQHQKSLKCKAKFRSKVKCPICSKEYAKGSLKNHIKQVHEKLRRYRCTICEHTSCSKNRFEYHMQTHTGEHLVRCDQCSFSCIQPFQLVSHMRTHTGDKPYKCESCDYAAAWNVQLKDHRKAHDSPKQVTCEQCNIVYKDRRGLNYHLRKVHSDDSIPHSESKKTNERSPKSSIGDDNSSGTMTLNSTRSRVSEPLNDSESVNIVNNNSSNPQQAV